MKNQGLTYEDHSVGAVYRTLGRTVSEADICAFVNLCGFNEPLFMDMEFVAKESVFKGRAAPGAMTFCLSEGLIMQTGLIHGTGMSYLGSEIRIVAPVLEGDTLRVSVTITDKRGRSLEKTVVYVKGHPKNPMTFDDVSAKFRLCAALGCPGWTGADEVIEAILNIERMPDAGELARLCADQPLPNRKRA